MFPLQSRLPVLALLLWFSSSAYATPAFVPKDTRCFPVKALMDKIAENHGSGRDDPGSYDAQVLGFRGDLDGDGVPDLALAEFGDGVPGADVRSALHFFVVRGACAHWIGGVSQCDGGGHPSWVKLEPRKVGGLHVISVGNGVAHGVTEERWELRPQGLVQTQARDCDFREQRGANCHWEGTTPGPIIPLPTSLAQLAQSKPALPASPSSSAPSPAASSAAAPADPLAPLFSALQRRGVVAAPPPTTQTGPLRVQRIAGDVVYAELLLPTWQTQPCPAGASAWRPDCGPVGRLSEVASALTNCGRIERLGVLAAIACQGGIRLQTSLQEKPARVFVRTSDEVLSSDRLCTDRPVRGAVTLLPQKSYCLLDKRYQRSDVPGAALDPDCKTQQVDQQTRVSCPGYRLVYSGPQLHLERLEVGTP